MARPHERVRKLTKENKMQLRVKDLIEHLQQHDPEALIYMQGGLSE